jgi:hypothetical protein
MEKKYEVVLTFIMPNQQEAFVIWDIELYGVATRNGNLEEILMDGSKNGFGVSPITVYAGIFLNPVIMEVPTPLGDEVVLIGKHILDLDIYE